MVKLNNQWDELLCEEFKRILFKIERIFKNRIC